MVGIILTAGAVWVFIVIKNHTTFSTSYQVIALIFIGNIAFLGNQLFIKYADQNTATIAIEACFVFLCNIQCLIDILFVRKQWITTRK